MPYIEEADYTPYMRSDRINQILGFDGAGPRMDAENTAMAIVRDALHTRYDTDAIFAKTGTARDSQVVRWVVVLVIYFLYERIPDVMVPERVVKNYDDVMAKLLDVEDGKASVDLPRLTDAEGVPLSKFRWGSETKREHNV